MLPQAMSVGNQDKGVRTLSLDETAAVCVTAVQNDTALTEYLPCKSSEKFRKVRQVAYLAARSLVTAYTDARPK